MPFVVVSFVQGFSLKFYMPFLFNFAVLILAQGFSCKVAMTGVLEDHGSESFFVFSHKDSLEKSQ